MLKSTIKREKSSAEFSSFLLYCWIKGTNRKIRSKRIFKSVGFFKHLKLPYICEKIW